MTLAPVHAEADPATVDLWDAVSVVSAVSGLALDRAKARVQRKGQRFTAVLLADSGEPMQTIEGTVRNGQVTARRTVHQSDVGEEPLQGTWTIADVGPYRSQSVVLVNAWAAVVMTRSSLPKLPGRRGAPQPRP